MDLSGRAFDILLSLVSRPNEIVAKRDLLARVWPDVTVEEGSLRFHIANLRKALGDGKDGNRYIATSPGRGYRFVGEVRQWDGRAVGPPPDLAADYPQANLPSRLLRMVGRDEDIATLTDEVTDRRFVTIVGSGGVGKTTVATAVGHDLMSRFAGAVHFVDLGVLADSNLVAEGIASTLGLPLQSHDVTTALVSYLAGRRILLILDTCEHIVDAVARLASRLFSAAPEAHILATSRVPLQVEGENVYRLAPLACAPDGPLSANDAARSFPANQLFLERAAASGASLELDAPSIQIVSDVCRELGGVPLAIELAAARVAGLGLQKTAELLGERMALLWPGQRTAPGRQKTLQATLDWSYELLSDDERLLLCRLSVFVGHFSIDAALEVVTTGTIDKERVFSAIDGLVAKSMVATRPAGAMMRYRLLDATRAYALQVATDDPGQAGLPERHASYYQRWLEEEGTKRPTLTSAFQRSLYLAGLANVRAALEWCFGPAGNDGLGVRLAVAAAPAFLSMSLLTECHHWTAQAVAALDPAASDDSDEMQLQAALGVSLMFTRGGKEAARTALLRSYELAEGRGSPREQIQILGPLQMFHLRTGEFKAARRYAERCAVVAEGLGDPASETMALSLMGISLHLGGELYRAHAALEAAFRPSSPRDPGMTKYLGFDGRVLAGAILARNLWLEGFPDRAVDQAQAAVKEAEVLGHPLTSAIALIWVISVFLWLGDLKKAGEHLDRLFSQAQFHALGPYLAVGRGFRGELAVRQGQVEHGIDMLRACLGELDAAPYELLTTPLNISLVQGLIVADQVTEATGVLDANLRKVAIGGDLCYLPELLRLKGVLALAADRRGAKEEAESWFRTSLDYSRRQGARACELRASIELASLIAAAGDHVNAQRILRVVFDHFEGQHSTPDVATAADLLHQLT
ncbi:MAG TPA: winged helix-turn-helix domain-containing protein [Bauldia sp.]|nr:winged helix-turn-helix domain-containing protein [Bauldia sp.]